MLVPEEVCFLTFRTHEGTLFLLPHPDIDAIVGAAIALAQHRYRVDIFDYVVTSNHAHLAARGAAGAIPRFVQYVKALVARRLNPMLDRSGAFWERRYSVAPILDDQACDERAVYIYGHGPKEGLVESPLDWPGLCSIRERVTGRRPVFSFFDATAFYRAQRRSQQKLRKSDFTRQVTITLSPWPNWAGMPPHRQREHAERLMNTAVERAKNLRGGRPVLGVEAVLLQSPFDKPVHVKHSPAPPHRGPYAVRVQDIAREHIERFYDARLSAVEPAP
jgi:hypothetical protein